MDRIYSLEQFRSVCVARMTRELIYDSREQPDDWALSPLRQRVFCKFSGVYPESGMICLETGTGELCFRLVTHVAERTDVCGRTEYRILCRNPWNGGSVKFVLKERKQRPVI